MRVAFAGAAGTGKTTLMKVVAEQFRLSINPVSSRQIAADMGFASPYDVDAAGKRQLFQQRLLHGKISWETGRQDFVTDRTVLDGLAYTIMHAVDMVNEGLLKGCVDAMQNYDIIFYCPFHVFCDPANDPQRVQDKTYHQVHDMILTGLLKMMPETNSPIYYVHMEGLEERKKFVLRQVAKKLWG